MKDRSDEYSTEGPNAQIAEPTVQTRPESQRPVQKSTIGTVEVRNVFRSVYVRNEAQGLFRVAGARGAEGSLRTDATMAPARSINQPTCGNIHQIMLFNALESN